MINGDFQNQLENHGKLFVEALSHTLMTMAGLEPIVTLASLNEELRFDADHLSGMMVLGGTNPAVLVVSASKNAAAQIISYMTGFEQTELTDDDLNDGIVEIVNMIAGNVKAKLIGSEFSFKLTSPFAIVGDQVKIITKSNICSMLAKFKIDQFEIILKIFYV